MMFWLWYLIFGFSWVALLTAFYIIYKNKNKDE